MHTLRGAFSCGLRVAAGQELVTRGPCAFVRHPSYTGLVVLSLSCGVWNPSLVGLLGLAVTTLPQVVIRIRLEERLMASHFGERWNADARGTRRLLPFVW